MYMSVSSTMKAIVSKTDWLAYAPQVLSFLWCKVSSPIVKRVRDELYARQVRLTGSFGMDDDRCRVPGAPALSTQRYFILQIVDLVLTAIFSVQIVGPVVISPMSHVKSPPRTSDMSLQLIQ